MHTTQLHVQSRSPQATRTQDWQCQVHVAQSFVHIPTLRPRVCCTLGNVEFVEVPVMGRTTCHPLDAIFVPVGTSFSGNGSLVVAFIAAVFFIFRTRGAAIHDMDKKDGYTRGIRRARGSIDTYSHDYFSTLIFSWL